MTRSLGVKAWATGAAVLAAMSGCASSGSEADPPPTPDASSSMPAPSTESPTPSSDSEAASASAENVVRRYFTVLDDLRQHPSMPLGRLTSVATGTQLAAQKRLLSAERGDGYHQIGNTKIAELTVQSVNLDNSDPSAGKVPTVSVDVCWNVSHADLVDHAGRSVVSATRADTGRTRYAVANYHWEKNPTDGWRIASSQDLEQKSCAS